MKLAEFQKLFSSYIVAREPADSVETRVTPKERLNVYRHNFIFSLLANFREFFPCTEALLGPDNFRFFVREFSFDVACQEQDIRLSGRGFADYMRGRRELGEAPFIAEVCQYEWADQEVLFLPTFKPVETIAPDKGLRVSPGLLLLELFFDAPKIVSKIELGEDFSPDDFAGDCHLLMFWCEGESKAEYIDVQVYAGLKEVRAGKADQLSQQMLHFLKKNGWVV